MPYLGNVPSSFNVGTNNIDNGAVTTEKIADGAVVNADVSASAAIAGTKISPDFGSQNLLTTGTATAASFIPSSSTAPTNGLYLSAANTVGISTGGSGRLFINSSGQVGVGATESSYSFGVHGTNAGGYVISRINNTSATGFARILFDINSGTNGRADISYAPGIFFAIGPSDNDTTTPIVFRNNNAQERLRITSAGLVGVGTSSPTAKTEISYSSTVPSLSSNSGAALALAGTSAVQFNFGTNPSSPYNAWIQTRDTGTNSAFPLSINPLGGNVGIGTNSPSSLLHVEGTAGNAKIRLGTGGDHTLIGPDSSGHTIINAGTAGGNMQLQLAGSTKVTLNSTGLGIGTASPQQLLHVDSGSGGANAAITLRATGYSGNQFNFYAQVTPEVISVIESTERAIAFKANGSERARIDSSGRLLVGTSSSTNNARLDQKLAVVAAGTATYAGIGITTYPGSGDSNASFIDFNRSAGSSDGSMTAVSAPDTLGYVVFRGADGTNFVNGAQISAEVDNTVSSNNVPARLAFHTAVSGTMTERMRIQSNGRILIGGTVDVGAYDLQVKATGVWGAGAYVNGSDKSLKEEIAPLASSLDLVKQLNPVSFRYKKEFSRDNSTQPGFIAQELRETLADQVYLDGIVQEGPEFLSVAYQGLIPVLAKALQEAVVKIETLEAKVAALESA